MLLVMLCFSLLAGKCYRYFHFACDWRVNVTSIFLCFSLLTVIFIQLFLCFNFYTVIIMFHLPYMDVTLIYHSQKIIHIYIYIYIYIYKRLIFYMYMWIIFEIGRLTHENPSHVRKVKHKNNCNFYLLYLTVLVLLGQLQ